ncbi:nuclear transport factor 2 family protein [Providencia alcalifaciens]
MNKMVFVEQALKAVLGKQIGNLVVIKQFFSSDYVQVVDGKLIDFTEFCTHMQVLKEATESITIDIKSIAEGENCVHTQHIARAIKKEGTVSEFEVFACFHLMNGKIIRCEELTRMLSGSKHDNDLGSRT